MEPTPFIAMTTGYSSSLPDQYLCAIIFREHGDKVFGCSVYPFCFVSAEVIAFSLAPVLIVLGKGIERSAADTVHMPVGMDEIHPFLAAIAAHRTVKEIIRTRIGLVKEGNEIVLHGSLLLHVEAELAVHGFQLVACFIHASILLQFCPVVKGIAGDFLESALSVLGVRSESSPKSLIRIGFTALTKMPASESHVATGS